MIAQAPDVARELFCEAQGTATPIAPFETIAHWIIPARALLPGIWRYEKRRVYVPAGCFYSLATPMPAEPEIIAAIELARSEDAAYVMYPCIRHDVDRASFDRNRFTAFPWYIESTYERRRGVERDLRAQLGGERFRRMRQTVRRYHQDYAVELYFGDEVSASDTILDDFDRLHRMTLAKYGHAINFYDRAVLRRLLSSALRDSVFFYFSRDRRTGARVQALLGLVDGPGRRMQLLVQGIDRAAIPAGHNLYLAALFELYVLGESRGIVEFNLGRGKQLDKLRLGANRFHLLFNYLRPEASQLESELLSLKEAAEKRAARELLELNRSTAMLTGV